MRGTGPIPNAAQVCTQENDTEGAQQPGSALMVILAFRQTSSVTAPSAASPQSNLKPEWLGGNFTLRTDVDCFAEEVTGDTGDAVFTKSPYGDDL